MESEFIQVMEFESMNMMNTFLQGLKKVDCVRRTYTDGCAWYVELIESDI